MNSISFALNQILFPDAPFENFISFSKKLNVKAIEIRNDIKTNLIEENDPIKIKNMCEENSIKILSINALQKFNFWNKDREKELVSLCKYLLEYLSSEWNPELMFFNFDFGFNF